MKTPGRSWAQYSFYKYIACTLQTTSKQVEIHNRLLRPGVSFLYAKRHSEMNATSAIIAARDLVRPPPWSGSTVNNFFDQGNFEAMKTLSGWEVARCDEHQFRAKIKVSTRAVLELSLF